MRVFEVFFLGLAFTLAKEAAEVKDVTDKEVKLPIPEEDEEQDCDKSNELGCRSSCRDQDSACLFLRLGGQCTDAAVYRKCAFSCSYCSCGDSARDCAEQLKVRSCSDPWMVRHCKLSCRRCSCRDRYTASYCNRVKESEGGCHRYGYRCPASCGHCTCEDTAADCELRAARGECVINMEYMMRYCKESCNQCNGDCKDYLSDCAVWISQNAQACKANPSFMSVQCAKSCQVCIPEEEPTEQEPTEEEPTEEKSDDCADMEDSCVLSARKGECLNPEVRKKCPFSCRQCVCGDLDQRCEAWAEEGKCYTEVEMMQINCRQTCEFCGCQDKPDHVVRCLMLASQGKCAEDPQNLVDCPESCNVCECGNNSPQCAEDALSGKCQSNPNYMLNHCVESCHQCNSCGDNPPFQGKICASAVQRGYCDTEPLFRIHCAKSCGICSEENDGDSSDDEDPNPNPKPDPDPSPWNPQKS